VADGERNCQEPWQGTADWKGGRYSRFGILQYGGFPV